MEIKTEINRFYELESICWNGACDTLVDIVHGNKEDEFMDFLSDVFCNDIPTDTQVNDFIWFERDYIYESMGLNENGELIDEEKEHKQAILESIERFKITNDFKDFCSDCDNCVFGVDACPTLKDCERVFKNCKNGSDNINNWMEVE